MTYFDYALALSMEAADRCHGSEVSAPEHCAFLLQTHQDIAEDYSLDPITAAQNKDEDLHTNH